MPLLETLPDFVEKSLSELREKRTEERETAVPVGAALHSVPGTGLTSEGSQAAMALDTGLVTDPGTALTDSNSHLSLEAEVKRIAFATDLDAKGGFGSEWLVVDDGVVHVFEPDGETRAKLKYSVPIADIKEAKAETYIGNGLLEVRTKTETIEMVRYSQAIYGEANMVARQITALAQGKKPKAEKTDEKRKRCPRCRRVLPDDTEVCPGCVNKRAVLLRLFQFLKPFKPQVVASVVVILVSNLLNLLPPWIGKLIIDNIQLQAAQHTHDVRPIVGFVGILLVARLLTGGADYVGRRVAAFLGARVSMNVRVTLYAKFTQLSLGYYDKRSTGTVMSRITSDSEQIWDFLTDGAPWFFSNTISLVSIGIMLFGMHAKLAALLLIPGPFIFMLNKKQP